MSRSTFKTFDIHNRFLDAYNTARACRPVLTADELRAAREDGCLAEDVARANDRLAREYDEYDES